MHSAEQTRIDIDRSTENYARIVIGPLEGGYGTTLGNALRRTLISSINGAAITSVKIVDVYHEFSVIPHAREDTTRLLLNLKQVRFNPQVPGEHEWRVGLMASGGGLVTAADLQLPSDLEVVNPEQPILTLDSPDADLHMEFSVRTGRGYSPADERGRLAIGELPVDAIFSPVRRVAFDVYKTRVGRLSNYDSLIMEIWTDGSVSPSDALTQAASILAGKFSFIADYGTEPLRVLPSDQGNIPPQVYETPIEELDLSVRAYNCLKRAGLTRVGEILDRMSQGTDEMLVIRNFGQKSLDELKVALIAKGFDEHLQAAVAAAGNGNKE